MFFSKVLSHLLIYVVDNFLLLLIRDRLVLLIPVRESEEHGGYGLHVLPLLELIIFPKLIVAKGPAAHHRWPWKLTSETLELDRVIILLILVKCEVLKLYSRSIIIFFLLFLHYEPVLGII
jgi:hypothetical protein